MYLLDMFVFFIILWDLIKHLSKKNQRTTKKIGNVNNSARDKPGVKH